MTSGSRRDFLVTTAKLGIGAATLTSGLTFSRREGVAAVGQSVRTIHLEAREITWELAPGKTIKAMTYNGQVPGPTIRAREG